MSSQTAIGITGVKATVTALKEFEPGLLKSLNKEIRHSLGLVRNRAQAKYPQGSWSININNKKILGSVSAKAGGGPWVAGGSWRKIDELSPGTRAAIFEFAGSRSSGATPQSRGLIDSLTRRYGQPGRFLWSAWDENGKQVLDNIRDAVLRAERELQANLDSRGESY